MTVDDLSAPLGQERNKHRRGAPLPLVPQIIAGIVALGIGIGILWAVAGNPFGNEHTASISPRAPAAKPTAAPAAAATAQDTASQKSDPSSTGSVASQGTQATRTITIIDGKTGARQEVTIPANPGDAAPASIGPGKKNSSR